jgi:hypothetical protein
VRLQDELELANALRPHRVTLFCGLTTFMERRDAARHGIREKGLAYAKAGKHTFSEWFLKC